MLDSMATAAEVGAWLYDTIHSKAPRRCYQSVLVRRIRVEFGEEFSYTNHNGNPAIDKAVLKAFGKFKDEHVVWDRADQSWRVVDDETLARLLERAKRRAAELAERAAEKQRREEHQAQGE